jgi:hypothetical protein
MKQQTTHDAVLENIALQIEAHAVEHKIRHSRDGSVPELWKRLRTIGARIKELHDKLWK